MKFYLAALGTVVLWVAMLTWAVLPAFGQVDGFKAQWTYGGEPDVAGFHLLWKTGTEDYAIGYNLSVADYLAPPNFMTFMVPLAPGAYTFVVTAYDEADPPNESDYSNTATLVVEDVKPGACSAYVVQHLD